MTREEIVDFATQFIEDSPGNYISADSALDLSYIGMKIYESPLFAFGAADDELYMKYKDPEIIGSNFLTPVEWLPGAKTVISFFLPFTETVKNANARDHDWPADEWLHARYEGQLFLQDLALQIQKLICDSGYECIIPSLESRFEVINGYIPNWSERHAAYACGLGTFGLSKGLITEKGISGRFGSMLTDLDIEYSKRNYTDVYEYCNMCMVCTQNCPAGAISTKSKDDSLCAAFLDKVRDKHSPRYGCGKCQVIVPCESGIPAK